MSLLAALLLGLPAPPPADALQIPEPPGEIEEVLEIAETFEEGDPRVEDRELPEIPTEEQKEKRRHILRELFGAGSLLGFTVLHQTADGGWYLPNQLMLLPPSAFFIIGFLIWAIRAWKRDQVEAREFAEVETREIPDERPGDIVAARSAA